MYVTNGNSFGSVAMTAYTGNDPNNPGAPGTVYKETQADGPGGGTLLLRAHTAPLPDSETIVNSNVTLPV